MSTSKKQTLYQFASEQMAEIVTRLLELAGSTGNFQSYPEGTAGRDVNSARLLLAGRGFDITSLPPAGEWATMWLSRAALGFDLEQAATSELYSRLAPFVDDMVSTAYEGTLSFSRVTPAWVRENAHLLPVMMHAMGVFSKQALAARIGSASDRRISGPASDRIVQEFARIGLAVLDEASVRQRMKPTTEGIVRDLVGGLLEEFVAFALRAAGVRALREKDYESLSGVVYDFRADFVVPDPAEPRAFIEVRKSSGRHASLYAKDKMFSAINWKGKHRDAIGVLVVDGPWSQRSLEVLAQVFDYVVPIGSVALVARRIREYLDGDRSALRWLITFRVGSASSGAE